MKLPLLFIDDEFSPNRGTIQTLGERFEVEHVKKARAGLDRLMARQDWGAVVVDMMMPAPRDWWLETEEGQYTGLKILRSASQHLKAHRIPALVFTNRNLQMLDRELKSLELPDGLLAGREKDRQSADDILELLLEMVDKGQTRTNGANGSNGSGGPSQS